jgi:hypothetical protein
MGIFKYKYNNKRLLTECSCFDGKNKLVYKEVYTYDNYKNLATKSKIMASGKYSEICKYEYTFDKEWNWISKKEIINYKIVSTVERIIEYY